MALQAVILAAGCGSRIRDLTADTPKALLPVANRPMIWYPLKSLEKAKFKEALIVIRDSHQAKIQRTLESLEEKNKIDIKLNYVTISDDEDCGTADTLRNIKDKIQSDVLLVSCDLITDVSLHSVIDLHRTYDSTLTMLFAPFPSSVVSTLPGGRKNKNIEKDFIGFDEKGTRVLFMASEADFEERITFRKAVLKRHPFMEIRSDLLDAHLYIMKRSVTDYLEDKKSISAVKGELIPDLVHKQFTKVKPPEDEPSSQTNNSKSAKEVDYNRVIQEFSSWNDHYGDLEDRYLGESCHAYVTHDGLCIRANTLWGYYEANKQVSESMTYNEISSRSSNQENLLTFKVPSGCVIGKNHGIASNVVIKKSAIGADCILAQNVKVIDSVLMDKVKVEEGASLTDCIVFPETKIPANCSLKHCIIRPGHGLQAGSRVTGETIPEQDRMMEIE